MSVIIDTSATSAVNCVGIVMNGALCTDSLEKLEVKPLSASEGEREEVSYIAVFVSCQQTV